MSTPEPPPPWAPSSGSIWLRRIGFVLVGLVVVVILALATLLWGLRNEDASAWIVRWLPGIVVIDPHGSLLGDFSAGRVEVARSNGGRIVITSLRWRDMRLDHEAGVEPFLQLRAASVAADRVDFVNPPQGAPAVTEPEPPPHDLSLPYALDIGSLHIAEIQAAALGATPLSDLRARLHLSADGGRLHRIDDLAVARGPLQLQGSAKIETHGALKLGAHFWLHREVDDGPSWSAAVNAEGPLAQPRVKATLRGAEEASLDLEASLQPYAQWPIERLAAQVQSLDLAALSPDLPTTQLDGKAELANSAGQPVSATIDLHNDAAGPWSDRRLPVRSARIELRSRPEDLSKLELTTLGVQLGTAAQPAGELQGSGHWSEHAWSLQTTVSDLRPARLDDRLPQMRLSGPLNLAGGGSVAQAAAASAAVSASAPVSAPAPAPASAPASTPNASLGVARSPAADLGVQADLSGELLDAPAAGGRRVQLTLTAGGSADDIVLQQVTVKVGAASATGQARARRAADHGWQLSGQLALKDFDPSVWLANRADPAWRRALHRLNAAGDWDLTLPPTANQTRAQTQAQTGAQTEVQIKAGTLDRLDQLRGHATLRLDESSLAGVPLTGSARLQADPGQSLQATARLDAAGNRLQLDLQLKPGAESTPWSADLDADAPALVRLRPLLQLAGLQTDAPLGTLEASAQASGERRAPATGQPAAFEVDAVKVKRLEATAGDGRLKAQGHAERRSATWQLDGEASFKGFDPAAWLPTSASWQQTRNRLNGDARWSLALPFMATAQPAAGKAGKSTATDALARLADVRGEATLNLADSLLAGVPLAAEARLQSSRPVGHLQAALQLEAGGNRLQLDAKVDAHGSGADDHWALKADAPLLARLAPVLRLAGIEGDLAGAVEARAQVDGRWPHIKSQGHASAQQVRSDIGGGAGVTQAVLDWQLGSAADAPAALQLDVAQARFGKLQIVQVHGEVQGSAAAHSFALQADVRGGPPLWTETLQAANTADTASTTETARTASSANVASAPSATKTASSAASARTRGTPGERTRLDLRASGSLDTSAAPRWHGSLQRLELSSNQPGRPPWAQLHDVALELQAAGKTTPAIADVSAGQAQVLGAAVRWDPIHWRSASAAAPAQIELHAEVQPLPIAPLLRQLQPDFGWGGDLRVGASIRMQSASAFSADVVLERSDGDLTVTEETQTLALGLTDLRLALNADQGLWNFTAALAGSRSGVAAAAVSLHTDPGRSWPPPDAAIEGVLEARVTDLGSWGTWLPPGWRLGGQVHSTASISGRLGAPELTGTITGSGIGARNILEGINVSDGELRVSLQGKTARIDRLLVHGGKGTAQLEGVIDLGSGLGAARPTSSAVVAPPLQARLQLRADHFQALGRVDRRIVLSGQAGLQVDGSKLDVDGRFDVDEGLIDVTRSDAPALSDDVVVIRAANQTKPELAAEAAPVRTPYDLTLDLVLGLGEHLRLRGHGIDTGLRGELDITSPEGQLSVNGSVKTVNGTYAAYSQKLQVDRGVITFTGPIANPRLDILATRPDLDVVVGVMITGNAVDPRIRLYSEPDMSDLDKLSYLMLGHASDGLGGSDVALLQSAALALLSGEGQGPSTSFTKALGLDSLSVSQGQSGGLRDAVVSVGKQISRRWYVGYEQSLNATAGSFQLIYRLARRFTLRAQSGSDNSIDVIWTWRFQ